MARDYRPVDRDQQFLLPPDMRSWLPPDHLVWFVISVVEKLNMACFDAVSRRGGVGRAGYDPRMLLAVLIYAYAMGERSSRQIERLCHTDVAFRIACAGDVPDHTTIARFRQFHEQALVEVFTDVLGLCARSGLGKLGTVAIDGTKIAANASGEARRSEKWLGEQASKILQEADEADTEEDAQFGDERGDELPAELTDPPSRDARIGKALADIEAEKAAERAKQAEQSQADQVEVEAFERRLASGQRGAADRHRIGSPPRGSDPVVIAELRVARAVERAEDRIAAWKERLEAATARGQRPIGRPAWESVEDYGYVKRARAALAQARLKAATPKDSPAAQEDKVYYRNITDIDARPMPTRNGWVTGYNSQLAVSADQLIIALSVGQEPTDIQAFVPMLERTQEAAEFLTRCGSPHADIGIVLADAGYRSEANITAPGPDRLIATGKRHNDDRRARQEPTSGPPPADASPLEAMDHRLRTEEGHRTYRDRGHLSEGVNGQLKDVIGLRRFARRGLAAVTSELHFAAAVHNILKLFRTQALAT